MMFDRFQSGWATCIIVALVGPAWGQIVFNNGDTAQGIFLRGVAEMSSASRIALAEASEPFWEIVDDPSATLTTIIEAKCGTQPLEVEGFLVAQALAFNAIADASAPLATGDAIAVPFCLRVDERVPVIVRSGDTPVTILQREYGVFGPATTQRFFELNQGTAYPDFDAFASTLRIGDEVVLPFASEPRIFDPIGGMAPISTLYAAVPDRSVLEQLSMSVSPVRNDFERDRFQLRYVENVDFAGADPSSACNGGKGEIAEIVDEETIRIRFAAEIAQLTKRLGVEEATLLPATVGIVDSGLATIGDDFFDERFFLANRTELFGGAGDTDGNKLNDDIYGRNYYSPTEHGRVEPLTGAPNAAHGTKMGALILGGLDLAQNWTQTFSPPVVRLKVVSFVDGDPSNSVGTASSSELPSAIEYLESMQANIINLSLTTEERVAALINSIRNANGLLFVVAAGNSRSGPGRDLRTFELYPARFGGDRGEKNLVTVGAHDLSGSRAGFSNFSNQHVDLLAPGCAVQTRTDLGETVLDNGTSPATAIVSFTAALVRALGVQQPGQIKLRLLVGTDFDLSLSEDAFSSGRLNVIKAISLYHDVVELRDGSPFLFGAVRDPQSLVGACTDAPLITGPVHKVVANIGGNSVLEIWSDIDQELIRSTCVQRSDGFSITFENEAGVQQIPISDIKEIVFGTGVAR